MSIVSVEKREIIIPPRRIEKLFITEIFDTIINVFSDPMFDFHIYGPLIEIYTQKIEDVKAIEYPEKINNIQIEASDKTRPAIIKFNLNVVDDVESSKIVISGKDKTWVEGAYTRLFKCVNKGKFLHHYLIDNGIIRFVFSALTYYSLMYTMSVIYSIIKNVRNPFFIYNNFLLISIFGVVFVPTFIDNLIIWLFPRYEYENQFIQSRLRKYVLIFLQGSSVWSIIIEKLFFS